MYLMSKPSGHIAEVVQFKHASCVWCCPRNLFLSATGHGVRQQPQQRGQPQGRHCPGAAPGARPRRRSLLLCSPPQHPVPQPGRGGLRAPSSANPLSAVPLSAAAACAGYAGRQSEQRAGHGSAARRQRDDPLALGDVAGDAAAELGAVVGPDAVGDAGGAVASARNARPAGARQQCGCVPAGCDFSARGFQLRDSFRRRPRRSCRRCW